MGRRLNILIDLHARSGSSLLRLSQLPYCMACNIVHWQQFLQTRSCPVQLCQLASKGSHLNVWIPQALAITSISLVLIPHAWSNMMMDVSHIHSQLRVAYLCAQPANHFTCPQIHKTRYEVLLIDLRRYLDGPCIVRSLHGPFWGPYFIIDIQIHWVYPSEVFSWPFVDETERGCVSL